MITEPPPGETVSGVLRVSILCEDSLSRRGLVGEHGLAMLIDSPATSMLLDTGPGAATLENARSMGVDLASLDAIVVSHGHYDHTGGLAAILAELGGAEVIVHPLAFRERYALRGTGAHRFIGPPHTVKEYEQLGAEFAFSAGPVRLGNGLWTTGEVQQTQEDSLDSTRLCIKRDGELVRDDFRDDVSVVARLDGGLVVLTGCGHAGVCSIVAHAQRLMGCESVNALIGGTHLVAAHEGEIRDTAARLHEMGVKAIMPCHCTGRRAFAVLEHAFPGKVVKVATGDVVEFTEDALRPHVGQRRLVQHSQLVSPSERRR